MKKSFFLFCSVFFALISCKKETQKNQIVENQTFTEYVNSLNHIKLPFYHSSNEESTYFNFENLSPNYDLNGFANYKAPDTERPLGILYKNDTSVGIIDLLETDYGFIPILTTYSINGEKIDDEHLYENTGDDIGYSAREFLAIKNNQTIIKIDSIATYEMNEDEVVENTKKIKTYKTEYRILNNGKVIKNKLQ